MYVSNAGYRLSLSSMVLIVRAARCMGVSVVTAGACGCTGCCCGAVDALEKSPGLAGVLTKAPGVGRWGVAGILCAMAGSGRQRSMERDGVGGVRFWGWRMNDDEMGLSSFTRAMEAPTFALRVMSLGEGESTEDAPERKRKKGASQRRCRQWLCTGKLRAAAKTK